MVQQNGGTNAHSKFIQDAKVIVPFPNKMLIWLVERRFIVYPKRVYRWRMGRCKEWQNFSGLRYSCNFCFDFLTNIEPSSAEVLGRVADLSRDDFQKAIKIADAGFRKYSTSTTFAERGVQLRKWYDLVLENIDDCKFPSHLKTWDVLTEYSGENPLPRKRKDIC
jgi:Aldehyde dehydrogenase family